MFECLVPDADVGHWNEGRTVTRADFSRLKDIDLAMIGSIIVLAGPRQRNEAKQKVWSDVAALLAKEAGDKVQIEFALAHSCCMIANTKLVVDASRTDGVEKESRPSS